MKRINLDAWVDFRDDFISEGKSIGFVPTMGALHEGHLSLLKRARAENDVVLLSIFVNPTQFNNPDDLAKYPSTMDQDTMLAESVGCDYLITPTPQTMYPDDYRYRVTESTLSKILCGAHRPGHFDGVLTVVLKLFNIAKATRAYFGEKDFQQLELVREMADSFFIDVEVIGCDIVREHDGLAMSSRNLRLSPKERRLAGFFPQQMAESLIAKTSPAQARTKLEAEGFKVDYVEDVALGNPSVPRRFGAVFVGELRLIDNMNLEIAEKILGRLK